MPSRAALAHLSKDPVMRRLIRRVGRCGLAADRRSPYEALVRAVTYQQLNGRAAETILGRVIACCDDGRFPAPATVLAVRAAKLRRAGLSRAKTLAIKDIARHAAAGKVPTRRATARMSDEQIVEKLTAIRGVGRWTVEMLLMFTLGRPDVLPVDDFGVRLGYKIAYGKRTLPRPKTLARIGEQWAPYRTTASWYLWRAVDMERAQRGPTG